jgi:probable nitrogen fixation protein
MNAAAEVYGGRAVMQSAFLLEMVKQMRSLDSRGARDGWPAEQLLAPFVRTPEERRAIPVVGDPDAAQMARVSAFYNAIAALIEKECGQLAATLVHLSHEGFGRVLITVGRLVVLDKTLRDVHRFGFESLERMKLEADKVLAVATALIGKHPDVAGL